MAAQSSSGNSSCDEGGVASTPSRAAEEAPTTLQGPRMDPGVRQAAINLVKAKRATEGISRYVPTQKASMLCAF